MVVLKTCVIIISVCIISITYAETNGTTTACVGSDVDIFCRINNTFELYLVVINHLSKEIGIYSTEEGDEVYSKFKDHYVIFKNMSYIQVRIRDVKKEDEGTLSCTIIYQKKRVTYDWSLIIEEKLSSDIIDLKIKTDTCTVLTCSSASSRQLKLKKPDNESNIGKEIVLNSCHHYLPPGEFSCCLMTNCSEAECNKITFEDSERVADDSSKKYWIIALFIVTAIVIVAITIIFLSRVCNKKRKTQRYKSDQNQEHKRKTQRYKSDQNQEHDSHLETRDSGNSDDNMDISPLYNSERFHISRSGESRKFENTDDSDNEISTINKRPQSDDSGIYTNCRPQ